MKTHDLGRAFWHTIRITSDTPPVHRHNTYLTLWPYLWSKSVILRISRRKALVLGWWRNPPEGLTETELLMRSLEARMAPRGHISPSYTMVRDEDATTYTTAPQRPRPLGD